MDPLSITASAIAIIQVTTDVIDGARSYYKSVKNAREEIAELVHELESFDILLKTLKDTSQRADAINKQQTDQLVPRVGSPLRVSRLPMLQKMMEADTPLSSCYNQMLLFKTKLTRDQSRVRRSLKWPFERDEIKAVIKRLRNLKTMLDTAIASDHLALNIDIQGNVLDIVNSLHTATDKDLIQRLSSWLSAPNSYSNLHAAQTKRQKDTGIWLLTNPTFLSWGTAPHSFFWLHGKAGCGKTILSSTVIRSLLDDNKSNGTVAYFYFDFQTHEKQLVQKFLSSIIVQLLGQNCQVSPIIDQSYNACDSGRRKPTLQETCVMLRGIIDKFAASVYIVVDALDECQDRTSLLDGLKDIKSWNQENLHIFVTSRRETEIEDVLCTLATDTVTLEESVVDADILTYVQYQLQHDAKLSKWPEEIREEIQITLLNGANGMFRWVECQINAIRGCRKLVLLRKALRTLPKTLDETYARILNSIPEEHVEDARRILSCLICAFDELAIEKVAETAAIVIEGESYYDIESRLQEPRDILNICSGLVCATELFRSAEYTYPGGKYEGYELKGLRLSHFSVKEYLISDRIALAQAPRFGLEERYAHELLATLCVNCLLWCGQENLFQDLRGVLGFDQIFERSAFAPYAASFWSKHLQAARLDHSAPLYSKCLKMLTRPAILRGIFRLRRTWLGDKLWDNDTNKLCEKEGTGRLHQETCTEIDVVSPLYYASMLGSDELVLKLVAAGEDINSGGPQGTCLAVAALFGHKTIMRLLLDKGAGVNLVVQQTHDWYDRDCSATAIQWAAWRGHEDIVNMLLKEGADVNICRAQPPGKRLIDTYKPLEVAVASPHSPVRRKIVQLLLDAGADVNACGQGNSNALLYRPILDESIDLITTLLDAGAYPDGGDDWGSALIFAIRWGKLQSAKLLIKRGADLESREAGLISVIRDLRSTEFCSAVEVTLELKPDLNLELLLVIAAKYGHSDSVSLMLRNGTAPDVQDETGVAALHAAAFTPEDDTQVVEYLVDANANVNIHGGPFGSALQAAALSGKAKAVEILLKRGASPDHAGGSYGTALQIAQKRLEDLEKGAYVKESRECFSDYGPDGYFFTPPMENEYETDDDNDERSLQPANRVGDGHVFHFEWPHLPNADYQAIIDVLQSHGAL